MTDTMSTLGAEGGGQKRGAMDMSPTPDMTQTPNAMQLAVPALAQTPNTSQLAIPNLAQTPTTSQLAAVPDLAQMAQLLGLDPMMLQLVMQGCGAGAAAAAAAGAAPGAAAGAGAGADSWANWPKKSRTSDSGGWGKGGKGLELAMCSTHSKQRSKKNLMDDGAGGMCCKPGEECKGGFSGSSSSAAGAGQTRELATCSLHGKMRTKANLMDDGAGGLCCTPNSLCQTKGAGGSKGGGKGDEKGSFIKECSVHKKRRATPSLVPDGLGGYCCTPETECQLGKADFGDMGAQQFECSVHKKMRSLQNLVEDGEGGWRCAPDFLCVTKAPGSKGSCAGKGKGNDEWMDPSSMMMMQTMMKGKGKGKPKGCGWWDQSWPTWDGADSGGDSWGGAGDDSWGGAFGDSWEGSDSWGASW